MKTLRFEPVRYGLMFSYMTKIRCSKAFKLHFAFINRITIKDENSISVLSRLFYGGVVYLFGWFTPPNTSHPRNDFEINERRM